MTKAAISQAGLYGACRRRRFDPDEQKADGEYLGYSTEAAGRSRGGSTFQKL